MNRNLYRQFELEAAAQLSADSQRHSRLAMQAAKRMSSSSRKSRTGRVICRHLLQMLNAETLGSQAMGSQAMSSQAMGSQALRSKPMNVETSVVGLTNKKAQPGGNLKGHKLQGHKLQGHKLQGINFQSVEQATELPASERQFSLAF